MGQTNECTASLLIVRQPAKALIQFWNNACCKITTEPQLKHLMLEKDDLCLFSYKK